MARCRFVTPLILLLVSAVFAQNPSQSDPQAVAFASQSFAALPPYAESSFVSQSLPDGSIDLVAPDERRNLYSLKSPKLHYPPHRTVGVALLIQPKILLHPTHQGTVLIVSAFVTCWSRERIAHGF